MTNIYIDDQDLTKVVYNGKWARGGTPDEYAGTVASSTTVGDSFTVTFEGTSIAVYGTLDATSGGVITTYSVDGASPSNATAQKGPDDTSHQQFWYSERLSLAEHKLHVTMAKVNYDPEPGEGTVWFDYFIVRDSTTTATTLLTPASTSPPIVNESRHSPRIGEIVGCVIGGLALVLAAILAFVFYRRRGRKSLLENTSNAALLPVPGSRQTSIHPFLLGSRGTSENSLSSRTSEFDPMRMVSRKSIADIGQRISLAANTNYILGNERPKIDPRTLQADASPLSLQESDNPRPREEVGGIRRSFDVQTPEATAELPPVYSPV